MFDIFCQGIPILKENTHRMGIFVYYEEMYGTFFAKKNALVLPHVILGTRSPRNEFRDRE